MDDEDGGAEVIRLPRPFAPALHARDADLDELPVRNAGRDYTETQCRHSKTMVDTSSRTVSCRKCGAVLDPVTVLSELANRYEALVRQGQMLAHRVQALRKEVPLLERQERNAKSRIRAARSRRGDDDAVEAAMRVMYDGGDRKMWENLPESSRVEARRRMRPALEAYAAGLAGIDETDAETA